MIKIKTSYNYESETIYRLLLLSVTLSFIQTKQKQTLS